jgi:hypothetical protein
MVEHLPMDHLEQQIQVVVAVVQTSIAVQVQVVKAGQALSFCVIRQLTH